MQQYDYHHHLKTFEISEEAYAALEVAATRLGTIEIYREHISDSSEPTVVVGDEERDHYSTDHLHITDGGDIIRHREMMSDGDDHASEDTYDLLGHSRSPERTLLMVYKEEWKRQEWDDNQFYWFEWRVGENDGFPEGFVEKMPRHIPRSADPDELDD